MITYTIECEPECNSPEGNASCIDDDTDAEVIAWIRAELEDGNEWAWCCVRVTATIEIGGITFHGYDYLGCCSYKSQKDFMECDDYYQDMCAQAREDLLSRLRDNIEMGEKALSALKAVES